MANSAASLQKSLQKMYVNGIKDVQKIANEATYKEMQFNSAEAQKTRDWEERMSNTSHQREVADLKAAGLNPVLSANGGAQSYTGASASATAKDSSSSAGSMLSSIMSSLGSFSASQYSADRSAAATRYAANKNLQAAQASAAATRYAADRSAEAAKYTAKIHYDEVKYATDNGKTGNAWGVGSAILNRLGVAPENVKKLFKGLVEKTGVVDAKSKKFVTWYEASKSKSANAALGNMLGASGIANTKENRRLLYLSISTNNSRYMYQLYNQKNNKKAEGYKKGAPKAHMR